MQRQRQESKDYGTQNVTSDQLLAGVEVLLVEDEIDIADLLLFLLSESGAEVTWVVKASEALAQVLHSPPDILVSNVKLPDRDGDWLIQQIREKEAQGKFHLPAIAITSYTREVFAKKMLDAGFEKFMPKDLVAEDLIPTILKLLQ